MQSLASNIVGDPTDFRGTSKDMKLAAWLSYAVPMERAADVAYDLLHRYRTIDNILRLSHSELRSVPGVCEEIAESISILYSLHITTLRERCDEGRFSHRKQTICDYCRMEFQGITNGAFKVFYARADELIYESPTIKGQVNNVHLYPRELIKEALNIDADSVYLVFGRSSGSNRLNKIELDVIKSLKSACSQLEISFCGADVIITNYK